MTTVTANYDSFYQNCEPPLSKLARKFNSAHIHFHYGPVLSNPVSLAKRNPDSNSTAITFYSPLHNLSKHDPKKLTGKGTLTLTNAEKSHSLLKLRNKPSRSHRIALYDFPTFIIYYPKSSPTQCIHLSIPTFPHYYKFLVKNCLRKKKSQFSPPNRSRPSPEATRFSLSSRLSESLCPHPLDTQVQHTSSQNHPLSPPLFPISIRNCSHCRNSWYHIAPK